MLIEIDEHTSLEVTDDCLIVRGRDERGTPGVVRVPLNDKAKLAVDTLALLTGVKQPDPEQVRFEREYLRDLRRDCREAVAADPKAYMLCADILLVMDEQVFAGEDEEAP
jgi:hypothetical protein